MQPSGNTLLAGAHGVRWLNGGSSAVILKNDLASATFRGLSYDGTNGVVQNMVIVKNVLGQESSYHLKLDHRDGAGFFLLKNTYTNGVSTVSPFIEPVASPVHFNH